MDKNNKSEKNSTFENIISYFTIFIGITNYSLFPPLFYYRLLQEDPELVQKHSNIFRKYKSLFFLSCISLKNDVEEAFEIKKKKFENHLFRNNVSPLLSFKKYRKLIKQNNEKETFQNFSNLVTLVFISGQFFLDLLELLTNYILQKVVKDIFQSKLGIGVIWFLFATLGIQGLFKKNYHFIFLNDSLPAFHVLSQKLSFETFKYILLKNREMTDEFSNFFLFDRTTKEREKTILQSKEKVQRDEKENILELGEETKSPFFNPLHQRFNLTNHKIKKTQKDGNTFKLFQKNKNQPFDFFPDTILMKLDQNQNSQTKQLYKGIFKEKFNKENQQLVISSNLNKKNPTSFEKKNNNFDWFQLYPRTFMRILPLANTNLNSVFFFSDGVKTTNLSLSIQPFLLKKIKKTNNLENWLQVLYSKMDEFPLKLEAQIEKTENVEKTKLYDKESAVERRLRDKFKTSILILLQQTQKKKNRKFKSRIRRLRRKPQPVQNFNFELQKKKIDLLTKIFISKIIDDTMRKNNDFNFSFLFFKPPTPTLTSIPTILKQKRKIDLDFKNNFEKKVSHRFYTNLFFTQKKPFFLRNLFSIKELQLQRETDFKFKNDFTAIANFDRYFMNFWETFSQYEKSLNLIPLNKKTENSNSSLICVSTRFSSLFLKSSSKTKKEKVTFPNRFMDSKNLESKLKKQDTLPLLIPNWLKFLPISKTQKDKVVTFPNRFRYSKDWDLQVKIQDPFPSWIPKWLHWIKYFGIRRKRVPVSMDDLYFDTLYEKYTNPYPKKSSTHPEKSEKKVSKPFRFKPKPEKISVPKTLKQILASFEDPLRKKHVKNFSTLTLEKKKSIYTLTNIRKTSFEKRLSIAPILSKKASSILFQEISEDTFPIFYKIKKQQCLRVSKKKKKRKARSFFAKNKRLINRVINRFFSSYVLPVLPENHIHSLEKNFLNSSWTFFNFKKFFPFSFQQNVSFPQQSIETILVLTENIYSPRTMSGYGYPDMEFYELKNLFLKFLYKNLKKKIFKFRWNSNIEEFYKKQNYILNSDVYFCSIPSSLSHGKTQMRLSTNSLKFPLKNCFEKPFQILISLKLFENNNFLFPHFYILQNQEERNQKSQFTNFKEISEYQKVFSQFLFSQNQTKPEKQVKIDLPPSFLKLGYWVMPDVQNPLLSTFALKQSFFSKFKNLNKKQSPFVSTLQDDNSLFYKEKKLLPALRLVEKKMLLEQQDELSREEIEDMFTKKQKKMMKDLEHVYLDFSAVLTHPLSHLNFKKKYQLQKWIEQNLYQDNPLNDLKMLLVKQHINKKRDHHLETSLVKKVSKTNFGEKSVETKLGTHEKKKKLIIKPKFYTKSKPIQTTQALNRSANFYIQGKARGGVNPKSHNATEYEEDQKELLQSWKLLPWFPTLDCHRKEIVVSLPKKFWTNFVLKKKMFLDSSLTYLLQNLEQEDFKTEKMRKKEEKGDETKIEKLQTDKIKDKLEDYDLEQFILQKVDVNAILGFFLPKTSYSRPTGKKLQKIYPFLDYQNPLSGFIRKKSFDEKTSTNISFLFSQPTQQPFYTNTTKVSELKSSEKWNEYFVFEPLEKGLYLNSPIFFLQKAYQTDLRKYGSLSEKKNILTGFPDTGFPSTGFDYGEFQNETLHLNPYSQQIWQQNTMSLDLVGGSYHRRVKFHYNTEVPTKAGTLSKKQKKFVNFKIIDQFFKFLGFKGKGKTQPEKWEPVTKHSWLIIYKIAYIWFVGNLLCHLYNNYAKTSLQKVFELLLKLGLTKDELITELGLADLPVTSRIFRNISNRFSDIAAIDKLLPSLAEIVWFLRNGGRGSKYITKGVLLVGPPGTGKTFIVKAIGGEAQVPVLAQSGSTFYNLNDPDKVLYLLSEVFRKAQQLAPSIIFIDEIDSLGSHRGYVSNAGPGDRGDVGRLDINIDRSNFFQSVFGGYASLEENAIYKQNTLLSAEIDANRFGIEGEADLKNYMEMFDSGIVGDFIVYGSPPESNALRNRAIFTRSLNEGHDLGELKKKKLNLLGTFLTLFDGVKSRQGVFVIGATNRADSLDPACVRPGRFDQVLHLPLPGKQKRIEIFQFYSQKLGISGKLSWDYLANRTLGWSIADIAVAINQSAMLAIMQETTHTIETLESGLEMVTNSGEKFNIHSSLKKKDPFFLSRRGFYQAAKALVHFMLPNHPPAVVLHLWPKLTNTRENRRKNPVKSIEQAEFEFTYNGYEARRNLETRLIGFYAGKAGEVIHLVRFNKQKKENPKHSLLQYRLDRNKKNLKNVHANSIYQKNQFFVSGKFVNCIGEKLLPRYIPKFSKKRKVFLKSKLISARNTHFSSLVEKFYLKKKDGFMPNISVSQNLIDFIHFYHSKLSHFEFLVTNEHHLSNQQKVKRYEEKKDILLVNKKTQSGYKKNETNKIISNLFHWYSDLGFEDLKKASGLAAAMIEKWHLYSDALAIHKRHTIIPNNNLEEYKKNQDVIRYMEDMSLEFQNELNVPPKVWHPNKKFQIWEPGSYYSERAMFPMYYVKRGMDWFRIYIPNREKTRWNVDWVAPDQYYHASDPLIDLLSKTNSNRCNLNTLYALKRDYLYHGLLMNSFRKALILVHNNRELLDILAYHIMRYGILRQPEIESIIQIFSGDLPKEKK